MRNLRNCRRFSLFVISRVPTVTMRLSGRRHLRDRCDFWSVTLCTNSKHADSYMDWPVGGTSLGPMVDFRILAFLISHHE